jgi:hypothetical protein
VTYEVVPPSWITSDGVAEHHGDNDPASTAPHAFVFPSLGPQDNVPKGPAIPTLTNFFERHNHFHSNTFQWLRRDRATVSISVNRSDEGKPHHEDATITISANSEAAIRRLTWTEFQELQAGFLEWLFDHTNCGFFVSCESRYTEGFKGHLVTLWKAVLCTADFGTFAASHLNKGRTQLVQYIGSVPTVKSAYTDMQAAELVPNQKLAITWGDAGWYPGGNTIEESYSRISSGGRSELQIVSEEESYSRISSAGRSELPFVPDPRLRLFPSSTCRVAAFQPDLVPPPSDKAKLPFPKQWANLIADEILPIYSYFDLRNPLLLTNGKNPGLSPACPEVSRTPPKHLFLLSPVSHVKPDFGSGIDNFAQFETEAVPGRLSEASGQLQIIAGQFILVGCDKGIEDVKKEWRHLLESAAFRLGSKITPSERACGDYLSGIFAGKAFVEVRNHVTVNGHPVEDGVLQGESIGQALATTLAFRLNEEAPPDTPAIVEVLRTISASSSRDGDTKLRIRFHTTLSQVLNQADVWEGDEIHGDSISQILH